MSLNLYLLNFHVNRVDESKDMNIHPSQFHAREARKTDVHTYTPVRKYLASIFLPSIDVPALHSAGISMNINFPQANT